MVTMFSLLAPYSVAAFLMSLRIPLAVSSLPSVPRGSTVTRGPLIRQCSWLPPSVNSTVTLFSLALFMICLLRLSRLTLPGYLPYTVRQVALDDRVFPPQHGLESALRLKPPFFV